MSTLKFKARRIRHKKYGTIYEDENGIKYRIFRYHYYKDITEIGKEEFLVSTLPFKKEWRYEIYKIKIPCSNFNKELPRTWFGSGRHLLIQLF